MIVGVSHVFISYSHHDVEYVSKLVSYLRRLGFAVWSDHEIGTGQRWAREIQKHINDSAAVVPVMSPSSGTSDWVAEEIQYAKDHGKPILPLLLDGEIFFGLRSLQCEVVTGGRLPGESFIRRLRAIAQPARGAENVLPFYLACETSETMGEVGITALNDSLPALHAELVGNPVIADKLRLSLLAFGADANVLLPLCDMATVDSMPKLRPNGTTQFAPLFRVLRETIATDLAALKANGAKVFRPTVFVLAGSQPTDHQAWPSAYQDLTDPSWAPHPNMFAVGFGTAEPATMRHISTVRAYMADGTLSPVEVVQYFCGFMLRSVLASSVSSIGGIPNLPSTVPGFTDVGETA